MRYMFSWQTISNQTCGSLERPQFAEVKTLCQTGNQFFSTVFQRLRWIRIEFFLHCENIAGKWIELKCEDEFFFGGLTNIFLPINGEYVLHGFSEA
jgi:hypothetical protein